MPPDRSQNSGVNALLAACIRDGDTLIEVGCIERPLAIAAVGLGAQGALVIDRDAAPLAAGAAAVERAGLKEAIRLARGDFATWPLIPAKHAICHVGGRDILPLLARLKLAARGGSVLLTRLRAEVAPTVADQMRDMTAAAEVDADPEGRLALLFHPTGRAAPLYEPAWRGAPAVP